MRIYGKTKFISDVSDDGITFTLFSKSRWYLVPFGIVNMIFAGVLPTVVIIDFINGNHNPEPGIVLCSLGMLFGFCYEFYYVLWQIAGKEIIIVSEKSITDIKKLFNYEKIRVYNVGEISKLRVIEQYEYNHHPLGREIIKFSFGKKTIYGENTIKIGAGVSTYMATQIIEMIRDKYPGYCE